MSPASRNRIYKWELDETRRQRSALVLGLWEQVRPERLFVISFAVAILIGTLGLLTVPAFYVSGQPLTFWDALFTSTSAVCVTGLIVVDTATHFTIWGQLWILLLIQVGGLGIITFTTVLIVALGRRPSVRQEALLSEAREAVSSIDYRRLALHVFLFTLIFEAVGFVLLCLLWWPRFGSEAPYHAAFHAISAFCNAGFSTFSDSVMGFQTAPMTLTVMMLLIVAGGLGFLTLEELWQTTRAWWQRRGFRLSLHSRIVLAMTVLLLPAGWVSFALLEWDNTLSRLPPWARVVNALFMSVTPRTAGFHSIDYTLATVGTNYLTILLMFIGGAPGSTAGGLKVTTVALPGLLAWSRLRGREVTSIWRRTVPPETIQRAVGLIVLGFALVTGSILVLVISEGSKDEHFLAFMFEAVSAFDTVGLSLGNTTSELSDFGKALAIVLMFLGRVGLPTVASALTVSTYRYLGKFRYAEENVVVG